jgi:hypothetical protein
VGVLLLLVCLWQFSRLSALQALAKQVSRFLSPAAVLASTSVSVVSLGAGGEQSGCVLGAWGLHGAACTICMIVICITSH